MSREIHFPPRHAALRDDVHALGGLVGDILREQGGSELFELVELDRAAGISRRDGEPGSGEVLRMRVSGRSPQVARELVRAFSTWFQMVNLAERVHRIRRRREYFLRDSQRPQPGGVEDCIGRLRERGVTLEQALQLIGGLRIEPVFAAHTTESARRTLLRKQQRVARLMLDRLDPTLTPSEARHIWSSIRIELTAALQTEELPRDRLTVADEREQVLFYLGDVLYGLVPAFYEEIEQALAKVYGVAAESIDLPCILRFGSWVGGDMDGQPDVHAKTLRETLARQQQVILNCYYEECHRLGQRLSQSAGRVGISRELAERIEHYAVLLPGTREGMPLRHERMPYRQFLAQIGERLRLAWAGRASGYESPRQFRDDVQLIATSLRAHRGSNAGLVYVQRLLRRLETFGFHLASLDVRQHANVLHQVIARGIDDAAWTGRSPEERRTRLHELLERDVGPRVELDALGKRMLAVFEAMMQGRHRYGREALGLFIVSGASDADDVLAALLLARWAEAYDKRSGEVALDIAPQFESLAALERCGNIMQALLADPLYRRHLEAHERRQCVVIGYSDSNKEAGLCASRFAIHQAQAALAQALAAADEQHVILHARGGSPARGGGRIDALLRTAPAGAVNGVLRVREQGETVRQGYGLRPIAMRTLERAFAALALDTWAVRSGTVHAAPSAWYDCAALLARASAAGYRELVNASPGFHAWFEAVTPIDVIERLQIGARSIYRAGERTLPGLLPVAWVYAWTQSRHMLPGWYGAGTGLRAAREACGLAALQEACANWAFLRTLLDDVEAMLARTDPEIAGFYETLAPPELHGFPPLIRAEYELACEQVLAIRSTTRLLESDPTLQRAIQLRNPYVDPMHLMQVDLLARWRAGGRSDRALFEALSDCTSGIAQGLQSTG